MSDRQLSSPKRLRGELTSDEEIAELFTHLYKSNPEPANIETNPWHLRKFKGIIRGDKHNSELKHDVEVEISNRSQLADYYNVSKNKLLTRLYTDFPNGNPKSSRLLIDAKVAKYNQTECHRLLEKKYKNQVTGEWSQQGLNVDAMGQYIYAKFGQRDPALLTLEDFQKAKEDRVKFYDERGKRKFSPLSQLRCIISFTALQLADSPMSKRHFAFTDGDEWDTTGLKNIGGKKEDYLQASDHIGEGSELERFIQNINEVDTLVMYRLGFEGGGRVSSELLMGTTLPSGYRCQAVWNQNKITMFEPKVEGSKTGGKVTRYFVPQTMAFFKKYVDDYNIIDAWFRRFSTEDANYQSYSASIKLAGLRANIWCYKRAKQGEPLAEGEKLASDGRVYRLKAVTNNQKGTTEYQKQWLTEGKMTTTHTVMKHTFVSNAGLHGLSLDDASEQCGTDPTTIRDFYHGTLGDKLRAAILGEITFMPWKQWIAEFVDPLFTKRYNELRNKGKAAFDAKAATQEAQMMAEVEDEEEAEAE